MKAVVNSCSCRKDGEFHPLRLNASTSTSSSTSTEPTRRTWYVLHVKPRTEKKVDDLLACLHVFHYLPLFRKETKVQRRRVVRFLPVFPGYVFTRLHPDERLRVIYSNHIVQTIEVGNPRLLIHQLRQVEHAIRLAPDAHVVEKFEAGDAVKVVSGPLRGLEGRVQRTDGGTSLILTVDILGQALEVTIDPSHLQKDIKK